jgi:hypothetical protein
MRTVRRILAGSAALLICLVAALTAAAPAQADTLLRHHCGNPTTVYSGNRAGLCADIGWYELAGGGVALAAEAEAFCQSATPNYEITQCDGVVVGVDMYRRLPNQSSWTMVTHSSNSSCGTLSEVFPRPCRSERLIADDGGGYGSLTRCIYFKAGARASIQLPFGGPIIRGIRLETSEWGTAACAG